MAGGVLPRALTMWGGAGWQRHQFTLPAGPSASQAAPACWPCCAPRWAACCGAPLRLTWRRSWACLHRSVRGG
jgi:hypothetical protein